MDDDYTLCRAITQLAKHRVKVFFTAGLAPLSHVGQ